MTGRVAGPSGPVVPASERDHVLVEDGDQRELGDQQRPREDERPTRRGGNGMTPSEHGGTKETHDTENL